MLEAKARGCCRVGILATSGTVQTGTYSRMCERHGLEFVCPDESRQQDLMNVIYGDIKQGKRPDMARFFAVADSLKRQGCTRMILGCTELSIIKKDEQLDAFYIDSMSVLAKNAITTFGRTPIGFEKE